MNDLPVFDISSAELSNIVAKHYGYRRPYDLLYSLRPCTEPVIEFWAGDWIHPCVEFRIDDIRRGRLTTDIELLLRLQVKDGALEKGLYRVRT